ncbi:MAG: hypothetical protein GY757_41800 [bacterium]|nr:hypothetical protein [bacterium]
MSDLNQKIKDLFEIPIDLQQADLKSSKEQLVTRRYMQKTWEKPGKEITSCVIPKFEAWAKIIKKIRNPLTNKKEFKKARRRIKKARRFHKRHPRARIIRQRMMLMRLSYVLKLLFFRVLLKLFKVLFWPGLILLAMYGVYLLIFS